MRRKRNNGNATYQPCEVCGWTLITEIHHEPDGIHYLCPNHHALITRNKTTFMSLKSSHIPLE